MCTTASLTMVTFGIMVLSLRWENIMIKGLDLLSQINLAVHWICIANKLKTDFMKDVVKLVSRVLANLRSRVSYTCQLFLRYKREIFILGVLGFLKTTRSFPKIPEEIRSLPKTSDVFRRRPKSAEVCRRGARSQCFSLQKSKITRKVVSFIHFTHGFRSLLGSELTYFLEIVSSKTATTHIFQSGVRNWPQTWAGVRSKFSTRRRETHA